MPARVTTGSVPGSGPGRSKIGLDRSWIFFWTSCGPCVAFLTNYVHDREGLVAAWQIAKCHAPAITVGRINSPSVGAQCGGGGWSGHEPTAAI